MADLSEVSKASWSFDVEDSHPVSTNGYTDTDGPMRTHSGRKPQK
jgi:hypothetical protein